MDAAHQSTICQNIEKCSNKTIDEISVIIPVKGDKKVARTVQSVFAQGFNKCEIFVIRNSHSSYMVENDYPEIACSPYYSIKQVLLLCSGKSRPINYGLRHAKYKYVAVVDADCILDVNALRRAVDCFEDESVLAVGGKIIILPHFLNILTAMQSLEYERTFNVSRRLYNWMDCNFIISGAFGVFRREELISLGGYDEDTVGEDLELILRICRLCKDKKCNKVLYEPRAICFTESPRGLFALMHQRERWQRGFIDAVRKNKQLLFNKKYGILGRFVLPLLCFEAFVGPFAIVLGSTSLLDAASGPPIFLIYLSFQVVLSVVSRLIDKDRSHLLGFIIKSAFVNAFSIIVQLLISLARIFGTLLFKKRRLKW